MKNETARREIESLDYYLRNHTNDYSEKSHTAMMMAIEALDDKLTTDAVPVVRCRDCKHWQEVSWTKGKRCINPLWTTARATTEEDFCSDGEREEE